MPLLEVDAVVDAAAVVIVFGVVVVDVVVVDGFLLWLSTSRSSAGPREVVSGRVFTETATAASRRRGRGRSGYLVNSIYESLLYVASKGSFVRSLVRPSAHSSDRLSELRPPVESFVGLLPSRSNSGWSLCSLLRFFFFFSVL